MKRTNLEDTPVIIYLRMLIGYTNHSKKKEKLIKELKQILKWAT